MVFIFRAIMIVQKPVSLIRRATFLCPKACSVVAVRSTSRYLSSYSAQSSESLPRVVQPSIWQSIVPKFLRERQSNKRQESPMKRERSKEWNPYTFFIIMFLLIGSNAINMIALRKDFTSYSRKADAKIALLKEAIERVQAGEDVDVKKLLGTGDPEKEQEWEEGNCYERQHYF